MSGIEKKVVVITGASSGIGEATAILLAQRGAKIVLGARGADRLKALTERIAASGADVVHLPTDVKRRDDVSNLVKLACERFGRLDVLFNNAGIMPVSPLDDLRVDDWDEMIDINIKGFSTASPLHYPFFARRDSAISSTLLLRRATRPCRTSPSIRRRSSQCARSAKVYAKKLVTSCALRSFRPVSFAQTSRKV
jgi:NADP-dependent 3-hydroxy acid dehydrogenase YdfG